MSPKIAIEYKIIWKNPCIFALGVNIFTDQTKLLATFNCRNEKTYIYPLGPNFLDAIAPPST